MNHQVEGAPHWELIGKKGQWKCLKIRSDSDGNVDHWPNWPYRPSSEERYLIQLGKALAQKDGLNQTGELLKPAQLSSLPMVTFHNCLKNDLSADSGPQMSSISSTSFPVAMPSLKSTSQTETRFTSDSLVTL